MRPLQEIVAVELTDAEWSMLTRAMLEWGGPARCTDVMAAAMGFGDVPGLFAATHRFVELTDGHRAMSRWDWARLLLATEIVFASTVIGSGLDWQTSDVRVTDADKLPHPAQPATQVGARRGPGRDAGGRAREE